MIFELDRKKQIITIEGKTFSSSDFIYENPSFFFDTEEKRDLYGFLREWFDEKDFIWVKTSGSTGEPKPFKADKARMMQSAKMTCSYLGLQSGNTALLCMKLGYIAGKMVIVRSLIAGLKLFIVPVSGNPLRQVNEHIDFAALVPLQVYNSLQNSAENAKLKSIRNLIIGGGAIDAEMAVELKKFPNAVYSTYGMTETLSHIALRRLNGKDADDLYTPLEGVILSQSEQGTLIINAPRVSEQILETNDVVEIDGNNRFRILGRTDNIINSGGIKIQIEKVEEILRPFLGNDFAITSLPDPKFGEIVVLVIAKPIDRFILEKNLPTYYQPKKIVQLDKLPMTETGKIERKKLKDIISEWFHIR